MRHLIALMLALSLPGMAAAIVRPQPGPGDPHIQTVAYDEEQVVQIQVATGYQLTLQFGPDEQIENVALGNSGAWLATANKRGDQLFVKPQRDDVTTNMTVTTDTRRYIFELVPSSAATAVMPYVVRFTYPAPAEASLIDPPPSGHARYRLSGARALRPLRIEDDGVRTTITWPANAPLPAVFALDAEDKERVVDGEVRDGRYVIDDVFRALRFRIDKQVAEAVRQPDRKRP